MLLSDEEVGKSRERIWEMFKVTIKTFESLSEVIGLYFDNNRELLRDAINEYLKDFIYSPNEKDRQSPEVLIFSASRLSLQNAGFYGAQLLLKEQQVMQVNKNLGKVIEDKATGLFKASFKKWVSVINNFLGSLSTIGVGEALKEIKDCLLDELPDDPVNNSV